MRKGVIDIGSNTVKLLVADVQGTQVMPVVSKDRTTRLGEGVDQTHHLTHTAIARTVQAIADFQKEARTLGATEIIALTTSAARDAENRAEFLQAVHAQCGLEAQVITGEREAELIFRGVSSDSEWSAQPLLVIDVGGGSAEFIQGKAGQVELLQSSPLGALRLTEKFGEDKHTELCRYIRAMLQPMLASYAASGRRVLGTGGTGTTAARIACGMADHVVLSYEQLRGLVERLRAMPLAERKQVPGLPPERADIIVAGGAVYLVAMEILRAETLTLSIRNLRYGAMLAR